MHNAINRRLSEFLGEISAPFKNNLKILQRLSHAVSRPPDKLQTDKARNGTGFILPSKG